MKRLCTICARGGSKGVENKNIRIIAGKPLIAYSIIQARESGMFDAIVVSSDSMDIIDVARKYEVKNIIKRPNQYATDDAPKVPVIQHALIKMEEVLSCRFDVVVDLDVTSPLRNISDIKNVVELLEANKVSNIITVTKARRNPYFNVVEKIDGKVKLVKENGRNIYCRQRAPLCYDLNASIYAWYRDELLNSNTVYNDNTMIYEMPAHRSIDIDSEFDFKIVKFLMEDINE
ncbi:acylneuraminate cytidylyltransferase family protein [Clostridiaceae bacterium M8S5]|nr:acylneuraminate cytidylyltransferase family protein [Clostridiaceae bacterium M8S5]